jgi:F-type H+-transporting ATPase subunit alpha
LLERPPGREAYPGDIFYIHSHLLERAGRLKAELGGGSMTFLPIAATLQGDITGYIQSNLVSITDGQIYLNTLLFREGFKPAIDMGLSVSRIGSKVQCPAVKQVSGGLRLEYAQYRELLRLTRLRTKLSDEAMVQMRRGEALHELLTQVNYEPVSWMEQVILFYALKKKILEVLSSDVVRKFKNEIFAFVKREDPGLIAELEKVQDLIPEITRGLDAVIIKYFNTLKETESVVEPDYAAE